MKGPGYKISHDVRRTWRCSVCGKERKLAGDVTSLVCDCREQGTFMTIVTEKTVAPRPLQVPQEHDVRSSEFGIDDMPVLQPHPSSLPPERTGPRRPRPGSDSGVRQVSEPGVEATSEPASPPASESEPAPPAVPPVEADDSGDEWGAGIL
jgi:hypothetical protein